MTLYIINLLLLVANLALGVGYVKTGETTKLAAFTWLVVGILIASAISGPKILP